MVTSAGVRVVVVAIWGAEVGMFSHSEAGGCVLGPLLPPWLCKAKDIILPMSQLWASSSCRTPAVAGTMPTTPPRC